MGSNVILKGQRRFCPKQSARELKKKVFSTIEMSILIPKVKFITAVLLVALAVFLIGCVTPTATMKGRTWQGFYIFPSDNFKCFAPVVYGPVTVVDDYSDLGEYAQFITPNGIARGVNRIRIGSQPLTELLDLASEESRLRIAKVRFRDGVLKSQFDTVSILKEEEYFSEKTKSILLAVELTKGSDTEFRAFLFEVDEKHLNIFNFGGAKEKDVMKLIEGLREFRSACGPIRYHE